MRRIDLQGLILGTVALLVAACSSPPPPEPPPAPAPPTVAGRTSNLDGASAATAEAILTRTAPRPSPSATVQPTAPPTAIPTIRSTTAVGTPTRQAVAPPPPTFPPGRSQGARGNELVDLQRSIDAQRAAKSFKLTLTESFSGQKSTDTTMEVTCPDRWRMFTTSDTGRKMEVVRIGRDAYVREERGPWTTIPAPLGVGSPCYDEQSELDPAHIYDEESDAVARLLSMSTHASLRQTAVRDVNGTPCQEWTVSLPPEGGLDHPQVVVCTGQTDFLPRRIALFDATRPLMVATFYDWNVPNSIERPGSFV